MYITVEFVLIRKEQSVKKQNLQYLLDTFTSSLIFGHTFLETCHDNVTFSGPTKPCHGTQDLLIFQYPSLHAIENKSI
jgi:hypothetical protein